MPATIKHGTPLPPFYPTVTLVPFAWISPTTGIPAPPPTIPLSAGSTNSCKSNVRGTIGPRSSSTFNFHSPSGPGEDLKTGIPYGLTPPSAAITSLRHASPIASRNVSTRDGKKFAKHSFSLSIASASPTNVIQPTGVVPGFFSPTALNSHITVRS